MNKELIIYEEPKSPISEMYRTLRTNIQFMNTSENSKTILITSTFEGEGKSWVSSNLATAFAQTGKKVLLIDADMRKGRQYSIFGVSPIPGLSNYLAGVDDIKGKKSLKSYIQKTEMENLNIMVAGNVPPNPSELLGSTKMIELLGKVRKLYDIIIIDGTPCQLVADSLVLTRYVDSTIVVAAYNYTKKKDLQRVINNINNVGGKIFGIVINKMPISTKKYGQAYYYGSSYEMENKKETKKAVEPEKIEKVEKTEKQVETKKKSTKTESKKVEKKIEDKSKKENAKLNAKQEKDTKLNAKQEKNIKLNVKQEKDTKLNAKQEKNTKSKVGRPKKQSISDTEIKDKTELKEEKIQKQEFTKVENVEEVKEEIKPKKARTKKSKNEVIPEKKNIVIPLFEEIITSSEVQEKDDSKNKKRKGKRKITA